jgi:hypothetical protein
VAAALASPQVAAGITAGRASLTSALDQVVARFEQTSSASALAAEITAFETAAGIAEAGGLYAEPGCSRADLTGSDATRAAAARTACLARVRSAYATVPTARLQDALQQRQSGGNQ